MNKKKKPLGVVALGLLVLFRYGLFVSFKEYYSILDGFLRLSCVARALLVSKERGKEDHKRRREHRIQRRHSESIIRACNGGKHHREHKHRNRSCKYRSGIGSITRSACIVQIFYRRATKEQEGVNRSHVNVSVCPAQKTRLLCGYLALGHKLAYLPRGHIAVYLIIVGDAYSRMVGYDGEPLFLSLTLYRRLTIVDKALKVRTLSDAVGDRAPRLEIIHKRGGVPLGYAVAICDEAGIRQGRGGAVHERFEDHIAVERVLYAHRKQGIQYHKENVYDKYQIGEEFDNYALDLLRGGRYGRVVAFKCVFHSALASTISARTSKPQPMIKSISMRYQ